MLYTEIPSQRPQTPLLDRIQTPIQLRTLSVEQLAILADELRLFLLYAAGQSGGHFAANLGVVELTIALHYCFDTPYDRLIWDVGHQAYAHKALTGRREALVSIRAKNGLAAFPVRDESEYDTFGVGHSSTAISAGLGMALAAHYQKQHREVVAVVGDGAMTAGMAFEAMNDAVAHQADLLVILNDNDMSISCSTGGFAKHLAAIWQSGQKVSLNAQGQAEILPHPNWGYTSRLHTAATNAADNLFKAIGFEYYGPFDGHDLNEMIAILQQIKQRKGPRLIHVYTKKGKGFAPAEADPIAYHAINKITSNNNTAIAIKKYADVFGDWLCDEAAQDERLLAITPAMCEGSGMVAFAKKFPQRFFDVAIAEQHAVTLAAGMACEGIKPVLAIYSTFLQRGYDQLIHDVALQNLDVTLAIDRAGLVGEDGPTHAGAYDYAYMRTIPNIVIMAPKDENECRQMLHTAYHYSGCAAVRYPRGAGVGATIEPQLKKLTIGKGEIVAEFNATQQQSISIAILAFGSRVYPAINSAKQLSSQYGFAVTVANMRFIKPLDTKLIQQLAQHHQILVTVEEHAVMAGAGSAVNEYLMENNIIKNVLNLGLPDKFLAQATHQQMLADVGLDEHGITQSILNRVQSLSNE